MYTYLQNYNARSLSTIVDSRVTRLLTLFGQYQLLRECFVLLLTELKLQRRPMKGEVRHVHPYPETLCNDETAVNPNQLLIQHVTLYCFESQ